MDVENVYNCIVELKEYSEYLDDFKKSNNARIDDILQVLQKREGFRGIVELSESLSKNPKGSTFISEHSVFKMKFYSVPNDTIICHDIQ